MEPMHPLQRIQRAAMLSGALLYVVTIAVNFDPKVQQTFARAFGAKPHGIPVSLALSVVETILLLPFIPVLRHFQTIIFVLNRTGGGSSTFGLLVGLFTLGSKYPELKKSCRICLGGLGYFALIVAAWIYYANSKGI
jgi:hypothetical protein